MSFSIPDINNPILSFRNNLKGGGINLKNGDIIKATVVGKIPHGGIVLSANGKKLNVMTTLNLPEGSRHVFQVNLTGSKIELDFVRAPVSNPNQPAAIIPFNISNQTLTNILTELKTALDQAGLSRTTAQAIQNLRQIMPMIIYGNPMNHNGIWIKENIMASGLFWESKIFEFLSGEKTNTFKKIIKGDLKGLLLSIQKALLAEGSDGKDALLGKVRQALNLIEGNQQLNLSGLEQGMGWFFYIPGLEEDGFINGEIFVEKREGKAQIFFSVLLELTKLGRFEANVSMNRSGISIRILMDDTEKAGIVNDNINLLEKGLAALGMKDLTISCDIRKEDEIGELVIPGLKSRLQSVSIVM